MGGDSKALFMPVLVNVVLLAVIQVWKFASPMDWTDVVLSFLLGSLLVSISTYLYGAFRHKRILDVAIILSVIMLVVMERYSMLYTLFMMVGVLLSLIAISQAYRKWM